MRQASNYSKKADPIAIIAAIALAIGAIVIISYAEKVAKRMQSGFGALSAQEVARPAGSRVDPNIDGRMVYLETEVKALDEVRDPLFDVGGQYGSLLRDVKYYQWEEIAEKQKVGLSSEEEEEDLEEREYLTREEKKKLMSGKKETIVYRYEKDWVSAPTNTDNFEDKNYPNVRPHFTLERVIWQCDRFQAGPYLLNHQLRGGFNSIGSNHLRFESLNEDAVREALGQSVVGLPIHLIGDTVIFFGQDPDAPQLGDVSISYMVNKPGRWCLLAQAEGDSLRPAKIEGIDNDVSKISMQSFDPDEYLKSNNEGYDTLRWVMRVIAWLLFVWATHLLKGSITQPLRRISLLGKTIPASDSSGTLWLVGTFVAVIVCLLCALLC